MLQIDGAMSYAEVWLNRHLVGGWPYGYASWQIDLTPYLQAGAENELAIRLDNSPDFSRSYPGAGLYRHVWLLKTAPVHIGQWGTFIRTPQVSASAIVNLQATVQNDSTRAETVDGLTKVYALDAEDHRSGRAVVTMRSAGVTVAAGDHAEAEEAATLAHPRLWGPAPLQTPNRYIAVTEVHVGGRLVDLYKTPFDIRKMEYRPDGLYGDGQRVRLQGVDMHHDLCALGAAFNLVAAERQVRAHCRIWAAMPSAWRTPACVGPVGPEGHPGLRRVV